jgi:hypothetical protein
MARINALFCYLWVNYTYFNMLLYMYKNFLFLWDRFHVVDIALHFIIPFLAEYFPQPIETFRKAWGQPDFCL